MRLIVLFAAALLLPLAVFAQDLPAGWRQAGADFSHADSGLVCKGEVAGLKLESVRAAPQGGVVICSYRRPCPTCPASMLSVPVRLDTGAAALMANNRAQAAANKVIPAPAPALGAKDVFLVDRSPTQRQAVWVFPARGADVVISSVHPPSETPAVMAFVQAFGAGLPGGRASTAAPPPVMVCPPMLGGARLKDRPKPPANRDPGPTLHAQAIALGEKFFIYDAVEVCTYSPDDGIWWMVLAASENRTAGIDRWRRRHTEDKPWTPAIKAGNAGAGYQTSEVTVEEALTANRAGTKGLIVVTEYQTQADLAAATAAVQAAFAANP